MGRHRLGRNIEATLVVFLALCSVAALQNVNVASVAVSFNDDTNVIQEGSPAQVFNLDVTITLASSGDHANDQGVIDRWSLNLSAQDSDGMSCATAMATLTPAQSGVAIAAGGQGTMTAVPATLDLSSCLCSSATELGVTLGSDTYTLTAAPSLTAANSLDCHGLAAQTLSAITYGNNLIENANDQSITLTIVGNSETQGRSVSPSLNPNWAVQVFIATGNLTHYTPIESTRVNALVPSDEARSSWTAGSTLTITDVTAMLNLTGEGSCGTINVLCTSLYRDPNAVNEFSIDGVNIVSCTPVVCIGVQIEHVIPTFTQATTILQGTTNANIQLTVTIKADDTKASISGTGLWDANVFGNANANCMDPTQIPGVATIVQGMDYGLDVNQESVWPLVTVSLNLVEYSCNDAAYICVEILKGANSAPPFTLSFSPEFAKYGSVAVQCIALIVSSGSLSVNPATHLAAFKEDHMMLFSVTFMSSASSGGAGGTDLWELLAFPAQNADGSGNTGPDTVVPLTSGELNTAFPGPSGTLTFNPVTATISLVSNPCDTYNYLCARLRKNANADPDFLMSSGEPVCSAMLTCQNVILTSTTVSPSGGDSPNGLPLYEGVGGQEVYLDVVVASDVTAGSVPSGSNHWQFDVSLGALSTTATLTTAQRDATLTAGTDLSFMRVMATLDLSNQRCDVIGDLCAEILRSSADTLGFSLDSPQAQNMDCFTPTCQGVEITSLVINDGVTNFDLKEGAQGHAMTFSVDVTTNRDAGSVRGSNLWKMHIYLSPDNSNPNLVEARDVTGAWRSQDVLAGETTTLANVDVTLDLDTTCANMRFLCIELVLADGQTFILDPTRNVLQTCKPVPGCNGIEIESASVALGNDGTLVEGVANTPPVDISLTFTDTSASVTGANVWDVTIYGSDNAAGTGTQIAEQMSVTSGNTAKGATRVLDSITWNVDMTSLLCVQVTHICVEVQLVDGASVSLVPTTYSTCSEVPCEGIVIIDEQFTLNAGEIFEAMTPQTLTVNLISAQAKANGAAIPDGTANIWDVSLFLNSAMNGSGTTYGRSSPRSALSQADQRKGISSNTPLAIDTPLNFDFTQNVVCGANLYVCLEIFERSGADPDYDITFPEEATCNPVSCTGIVFTSASLTVPDNTKLIENEPAHPVRVSFQADSAASTATLDSGSNFWTLTVFANTRANGTGAERYGEAQGTLSSQQLNTPLAADSTITLSSVDANLNLNGFVCPSDTIYLCAELQRNLNSVPPFTVQGMPSPLIACESVECQGVLITSINIAGAPQAVIEGERNDLTLTVTAGVGGADASGTNLWEMEATLVDVDGMILATMTVNLGDQADSAVVAGQPITFGDLSVPFDLTDEVCPSNGTVLLCIELSRGGSADADFTVTGVTRQCQELLCRGVVIVQSSISASTGSLLEGRASNVITLDVSYTSDPNGASISGTDLWTISVFGNNQEDGQGERKGETFAVLQGNDNDFPLNKGDTVEFNSVGATLDLDMSGMYLVCQDVHWVCAELRRGNNPSKAFSLTDTGNARIACTSLTCTGVQISNTVFTLGNNALTEDSGLQTIMNNRVTLTGASGSSTLPIFYGENFQVEIFGNSMEDTSGRSVAQASLDVASSSNQGLTPGANTVLDATGLARLNLTDVFCADLQFLCVRVSRFEDAFLKFKMEGVPTENSLLDCIGITCKGVRVTGGSVMSPSPVREGNPAYRMTLRVEFDTDVNGASVRSGGRDLFQLKAFLADTADGEGLRGVDQNVTLPEGSESQPVDAGQPITFVGAVATLDTTAWTCQTENFICLRLSKDPAASRNYLLDGWDTGSNAADDTKLLKCTAIPCRGVNITDVIFEVDGALSFEERDPSAEFTLDLGLVVDPEGGGVTGTGLWNLTFALNSMGDGSGDSIGETVAVLSPENADRPVDPAGPRTNLTDVEVTLPLEGVACSDVDPFYLCVKIEEADGSSPDFTLTVDEWHCTLITCYSVRISGLSFEVDYPDSVLENAENNLRVNLNVTTDALSADISGTGLWASPMFHMRNAANTVTLTALEEYWTQPLASTALEADDTTTFMNIFPVKFTPDGIVCSELTQLCMTFAKGVNPDPEFDLEFLTPNSICLDIECRGVEIISTVIMDVTEGLTVTERDTDGQLVLLSLRSTSAADGASINGSDLWAFTVYYTPNANGAVDPTIGSAEMDLTADQRDADLEAGQDLELANLRKGDVDLSNLVCPETELYLCVKIMRHANPSTLFTLSAKDGDKSALIGCTTVECIGVQIETTQLAVTSGLLIPTDRPASHTVDFGFTSTPSACSAPLSGTGLWRMKAFANRRMDGSHHRRSYEADVALTTEQMNVMVSPGVMFQFADRSENLNLLQTDTECRETQYFCGQLLKGDSPNPLFSLQGVPDDSALINCVEMDCNGVRITNFDLTNAGGDILRENQDGQLFSFDVALTSDAAKASATGNDLWTFKAFLNNARDCLGDAEEVALKTATLDPNEEDQDLAAGGTVVFNVAASMDYGMKCPDWDNVYICLEVFRGDTSTDPFTLFGDILKGVPIVCRGVEVTRTDISRINTGSLIVESDDDVAFDLNLEIRSVDDASSISGTGLWSVDVFLSDEPACQTETSDRVTSSLSLTNRNRPLVAGEVVFLNNVEATVPLQGVLCEDVKYVCVVLGKGPSPSPDFTLVPVNCNSSLIDSLDIECRGLHIVSSELALTEGDPLIANDPQHPVSFDLIFSTHPDGTSLSNPEDLFRLQVAAAASPDAAGVAASEHKVTVPYSPPPGFTISAGQRYTLPVDTTLNLRGARCDEIPYICVTMMKGDNPDPPFTLTPDVDDPVLTACSERIDCIGVKIANQQLTIESGIPFVEHAMFNPVELTVRLTSADDSGDALGINLWSAEVKLSQDDPLAPGTEFLAVTTGMFVGDDAGTDLQQGETIAMRLQANLNLTGISCSDVTYLVVNITNPDADPEFTLQWTDDVEYVVVSQSFTCFGVYLQYPAQPGAALVVSDGFPLKELAPFNEVTFTVNVDATPQSATVTGQDLWQVRAFVSPTSNGDGIPEDEKADADLTPAQGAVAIVASATSTLGGVVVSLDTSDKYCSDMSSLCVEVWRGESAQPYYNIEAPTSQAELRTCVPAQCNGVVIMEVTPTFASIYPLIEMRPNQVVRLDVNVTATPNSAGIDGDDLWAATVFVNSQPDSSGTRYSVREAVIDPDVRSSDLVPDSVLTLEDLAATMDFTGLACDQMRYICLTLQENDDAEPDFNLAGDLTTCIETDCISVAIESGTLSLASHEVLEGDDQASFSLDVSFDPWSNSRSLQADESWTLHAYTTDRGDGLGPAFSLNQVTLTQAQRDQAVAVGTPLAFGGREVTLDLSSQGCETTTHLCLVLGTQAGVDFVLGGYPTRASLAACAELLCSPKEVELSAVEVTERRIVVEFTEAFGDFDLYVLTYTPTDGITTSPFSIPRNLPRMLTFDLLVPGREYTIELTLRDGADEKAGPFTLVERTRPNPVVLQLDNVTSSELAVSWNAAVGVFDHYTIILDPPDNGLPRSPVNIFPVQDREVTFTGLLTARQYSVTIYTVSGDVESLPSSVNAVTDPSTPILTSTGHDETSVDLQWFISESYNVNQFEIRHQPTDGKPQPVVFPGNLVPRRATLEDLTPGRRYVISLVAVSNISGMAQVRSAMAQETVQLYPKAPQEINYRDPTETSVQISWPLALGDLDYYRVIFSPSANLAEMTVPKNAPLQLLYQGLNVASEYTVTITTHIAGINEELVSRPVTRTVYTLPYPPGPLAITAVTTNQIEFQWLDAQGPRDGYEVTFDPNEAEFDPQSPYFTTGTSMLLTGIKPHVTVDFEVRTKIGDVLSRPQTLRQRTFPTLPGQVRDFQITGYDSDNIQISFKIPESPNGLILAYLVTVEGTKPGEPSESAFQTITALPNDVQFEEIISPLKAGYTYTLSIQAINTEGAGEAVALTPQRLPIKEPYYEGQSIDQFIFDVTSSTISLRFPKSLFSDRNGIVTSYSILVVEEGADRTAGANPPNYQSVRNFDIKPVYVTINRAELFGSPENRRRRQADASETAEVVIGDETPCPNNDDYCNGPLDAITQYRISIRAYTEEGLYSDTTWSNVISTRYYIWWFIYVLIPLAIIVLIIAFIMCLCCCIGHDDRDKRQAKRVREKEPLAESQLNENSSNNVTVAAAAAPEPPAPAPARVPAPATPPPKRTQTSRPIAVVKFGQHVSTMSFAKEFEDLNLIGETRAKTVGALPENEDKNRYGNIVPFDFNRVRLNKDEDYINASIMSGFTGDKEYIAAQGPQANSVNDFWQMIWEQKVPTIAVIGTCVEKERVKFAQYWPSDSTPITFGEVTVNRVSEREETELGYIVRDLCLESGSEVRALRQYQFTAWPVHGVPEDSEQMLRLVHTVRSHLPQNAGPLVVHCGAGIGRTGVFIALDILTQRLASDEEYIDVFGTVADKRQERTNMVQTELQYKFVHTALVGICESRITEPKRRDSVDSDQRVEEIIADAAQ